jgi:hypothetical protein
MNSSHRLHRRLTVAVLILFLLVFLLFSFLRRGDQRVERATAQIEPGMTQEEVEKILRPADFVQTPAGADELRLQYYGIDEFVTVILDKKDDRARVSRVEHLPDQGPWWDRYRRRWHHRFRLR